MCKNTALIEVNGEKKIYNLTSKECMNLLLTDMINNVIKKIEEKDETKDKADKYL